VSTAPQLERPALPAQLTSFVGRRAELAELTDLLARHRLVTITGAGGCGKTRLAIEGLRRVETGYPDGAWWVDLAPVAVAEPGRVAATAAAALGVLVDPAGGPVAALAGQLRDRTLVVGLDNCEHVADGCLELVDALLRACPGVTVLATSRQPLGVAGEVVWRVPSLVESEAVALFGDRARLVLPDFAVDAAGEGAVRTVCRRLDGIPLAIELAAAWVRMLSPSQIDAALDDRFRLLVGGPRSADPRQQTLAASVDWSHGLLRDDGRTLLRRLAVFSGGFTLAAAEAVCGFGDLDPADVLTVLGGLVDGSIVVVGDRDGEARYGLPETIRQYGADRLDEAGEGATTRDRHLAHQLAEAEAAAAALAGGDQDVILAGLEREHDNLRAALDWGLSGGDRGPDAGRRLAAALTHLWFAHGHTYEGIRALQRAIDAAPDDRSALQAELLSAVAIVSMPGGRLDLTDEASRRAMELATGLAGGSGDGTPGDGGGRADDGDRSGGRPDLDRTLGRAHAACLYVPFYVDFPRVADLAATARRHAEAAGDAFVVDFSLLVEACALTNLDRHDQAVPLARRLYERAMPRHDRVCAAFSRSVEVWAELLTGDVRRAVELGTEAVAIARPLNDYFTVGTNTTNLAWAMGMAGDVAAARRLMDSVVRSVVAAGPDVDVVGMGVVLAKLLLWASEPEAALGWLERAVPGSRPLGDDWLLSRALPTRSEALRRLGRTGEAREAAERGLAVATRLDTPHTLAESLDALAAVVAGDDPGRADDLRHEALRVRLGRGLRSVYPGSLDALAGGLVAGAADRSSDRLVDAARLLAASDAARARIGHPRPACDREAHAALVASLRSALGDERFAAARAEGAELTLDAAVAHAARSRGPRRRAASGWASLTPAEEQVVALVTEGLPNPEIARRLFVSRATVKTHLSHIYAKLGMANRTELAAAARVREAPGAG
jgi:predicted ATPase/DNA-binding CsgD family transcriptional regulator